VSSDAGGNAPAGTRKDAPAELLMTMPSDGTSRLTSVPASNGSDWSNCSQALTASAAARRSSGAAPRVG
jgi:hypothetical protein